MDEFDNQLKEMFSKIKVEEVPVHFSENILKKIDMEKERREKRNENMFQLLIIVFSSIAFIVCMYLLNRYFFKIETDFITGRARDTFAGIMDTLSGMMDTLKSKSTSLWSIVGINAALLIMLNILISRKISQSD